MNRRTLTILSLALCLVVLATVNSGARNVWTPQTSGASTTQTKGKAEAATVRFVALGDTGTGGKGQLAVARRMVSYHDEKPYDTVLLLGDNVYPNGDPSELPAKFERPYAELLRRGVRFHAVLGNHDVNTGGGAGQINYKPFNMGGRAYYSFVEGNGLVEFFALNSNNLDQAQLNWLDHALSASKARWKIAYFHHPIYSSGMKHGSNMKLRALLEPLLLRHGVAATFSGHDHIYERITLQQGVQHFVAGAGGQLRRGNMKRDPQLFAAGSDEFNSFMYVEVTPARLTFWAIEPEGRILDVGYLSPPKSSVSRQ